MWAEQNHRCWGSTAALRSCKNMNIEVWECLQTPTAKSIRNIIPISLAVLKPCKSVKNKLPNQIWWILVNDLNWLSTDLFCIPFIFPFCSLTFPLLFYLFCFCGICSEHFGNLFSTCTVFGQYIFNTFAGLAHDFFYTFSIPLSTLYIPFKYIILLLLFLQAAGAARCLSRAYALQSFPLFLHFQMLAGLVQDFLRTCSGLVQN